MRRSINKIPLNLTEEYFRDLVMRDFLAEGSGSRAVYDDAPNEEEKVLLREFKKCGLDFEKFRERKIVKEKARKLKSKIRGGE